MAKKAFCHKSSLAIGGTSSHQRGNLASKTTGKCLLHVMYSRYYKNIDINTGTNKVSPSLRISFV